MKLSFTIFSKRLQKTEMQKNKKHCKMTRVDIMIEHSNQICKMPLVLVPIFLKHHMNQVIWWQRLRSQYTTSCFIAGELWHILFSSDVQRWVISIFIYRLFHSTKSHHGWDEFPCQTCTGQLDNLVPLFVSLEIDCFSS